MKASDILFDLDLAMSIRIDQQPEPVLLQISDSLKVAKQTLSPSFKKKIADFINSSSIWFFMAIAKIKDESKHPKEISLMQIHILSEQDQDSLVLGLEFWVDFDVEHGRGIKIDVSDFVILEYGFADVAFT